MRQLTNTIIFNNFFATTGKFPLDFNLLPGRAYPDFQWQIFYQTYHLSIVETNFIMKKAPIHNTGKCMKKKY